VKQGLKVIYYSILCTDCGVKKPKSRVVGGSEADANEYPWLVAIFFGNFPNITMHCGGTILNSKWVLTTRHCLYKNFLSEPSYQPSEVHVFFGEHNVADHLNLENWISHDVEEIFLSQAEWFGFALIKMKNSIDLKEHNPICLPQEGDEFRGMTAHFAGWGHDEISHVNETNISPVVQEIELPIATAAVCNKFFEEEYQVESGTHIPQILCIGGEEGKNACFGDNGAPLIIQNPSDGRWKLAGILDGLHPDMQCGKQGVYGQVLNVPDFVREIKETISSGGGSCDETI